jgi:hypothetical protein
MLILPLVWLQGLAGVNLPLEKRVWISIVPAMVAAIVVAWPFARLLRIPPMFVFSGPGPACKRRPAGWWKHGTDAGEWQLACGECGERVRLGGPSATGGRHFQRCTDVCLEMATLPRRMAEN